MNTAEVDAPCTDAGIDSARIRVLIGSALAYAGGTHTVADVLDAISRGDAQLWSGPNSCIVTEIDRQPRQSILNFFLAAGIASELEAMEPGIVAWGRTQGCTDARFVGRKGWAKSFLPRKGWHVADLIIMEKSLVEMPYNG